MLTLLLAFLAAIGCATSVFAQTYYVPPGVTNIRAMVIGGVPNPGNPSADWQTFCATNRVGLTKCMNSHRTDSPFPGSPFSGCTVAIGCAWSHSYSSTTVSEFLCPFVTARCFPSGLMAQSTPVALAGQVSSAEEAVMEGVLVSAKRVGSNLTLTVVTDAQGRYQFPAAKLEPEPVRSEPGDGRITQTTERTASLHPIRGIEQFER